MPGLANSEQKLTSQLQKANIKSLEDKDAASILVKAKKYAQNKKWLDSAIHYAALANNLPKDSNLSLLAARTYQKAEDIKGTSRWYLETAERYANQYHVSKAIAALRVYVQLNPDDKATPKRIYELCRQHGASDTPPSMILSDEDRAGSKLLANDLFKGFDSRNFDALIKVFKYRELADQEVLTHMGDKAESLFIIISGAISGYLTLNHKRTYLGDVYEDDICGETAYFTGGHRTAELVAKGETQVFELPYIALDGFKQKLPSFNKHIEGLYKSRMLVKQLAVTPVFEAVTAQCREEIASKMKAVRISAGQTLFEQGDDTLDLYLVRSGRLAVTLDVQNKTRLLKTIETGGIIGEIAISANKKRTATVRTVSDCILMRLDGADYTRIYAKCPPLEKILHHLKAKHIQETLNLMKNVKIVEGDDTCEVLLKDIWTSK